MAPVEFLSRRADPAGRDRRTASAGARRWCAGSAWRRRTRSTSSGHSPSPSSASTRRRWRACWPGSKAGSAEVKREPEARHDMVRIMTVHGAKGLQAPIVFLADDMSARAAGAPTTCSGTTRTACPVAGRRRQARPALRTSCCGTPGPQGARRNAAPALCRADPGRGPPLRHRRQPSPISSRAQLARPGRGNGMEGLAEPFAFEATATRRLARPRACAMPSPGRRAGPQPARAARDDKPPSLPARTGRRRAGRTPYRPAAQPLAAGRRGARATFAAGRRRARRRPRRGRVIHRLLELLPDIAAADRPGRRPADRPPRRRLADTAGPPPARDMLSP